MFGQDLLIQLYITHECSFLKLTLGPLKTGFTKLSIKCKSILGYLSTCYSVREALGEKINSIRPPGTY